MLGYKAYYFRTLSICGQVAKRLQELVQYDILTRSRYKNWHKNTFFRIFKSFGGKFKKIIYFHFKKSRVEKSAYVTTPSGSGNLDDVIEVVAR